MHLKGLLHKGAFLLRSQAPLPTTHPIPSPLTMTKNTTSTSDLQHGETYLLLNSRGDTIATAVVDHAEGDLVFLTDHSARTFSAYTWVHTAANTTIPTTTMPL